MTDIYPAGLDWIPDWELADDERLPWYHDLSSVLRAGPVESTLVLEFTSVGQPRQIRESISRLGELRRDLPSAYPVAVAEYVSPQSATLLRRAGIGYLDLSGNCYLSFDHVLIEKEGRPNLLSPDGCPQPKRLLEGSDPVQQRRGVGRRYDSTTEPDR